MGGLSVMIQVMNTDTAGRYGHGRVNQRKTVVLSEGDSRDGDAGNAITSSCLIRDSFRQS